MDDRAPTIFKGLVTQTIDSAMFCQHRLLVDMALRMPRNLPTNAWENIAGNILLFFILHFTSSVSVDPQHICIYCNIYWHVYDSYHLLTFYGSIMHSCSIIYELASNRYVFKTVSSQNFRFWILIKFCDATAPVNICQLFSKKELEISEISALCKILR